MVISKTGIEGKAGRLVPADVKSPGGYSRRLSHGHITRETKNKNGATLQWDGELQ